MPTNWQLGEGGGGAGHPMAGIYVDYGSTTLQEAGGGVKAGQGRLCFSSPHTNIR